MGNFLRNFVKAIRLSLEDVSKNIFKSLISSFGILFLIAFLILYISLRDSIKTYVDKNVFGTLAIDEVKISVKTAKKFDMFAPSKSTGGIPPRVVAAIKKMPEVKKTYTLIQMDHKTYIKGELLGQKKKIYIPLGAIENDYFRDRDKNWRTLRMGDPIPLVAPRFGIDMINNYLSMNGYPTMPPEGLRGFPLELTVQSTPPDFEPKKDYTYNAVIHTVTDDLPFAGVIVPVEFISTFIRQHKDDAPPGERPSVKYVSMYVKVKDIKKLPETVIKFKQFAGIQVESQEDVAAKTNKALLIIDGSSFVIIGMFLILTVISIFNSYLTIVYNRSQKFSLRRVLGVPKYQIIMGFVIEAAFVGALYGLAGYYAGNWLLDTASAKIGDWVPSLKDVIVKTDSTGIFTLVVMLSAAIASVSALFPAAFAANMNLFKAMRK
jgi:ABC-type antimicrobial peptide transport system permease subunit